MRARWLLLLVLSACETSTSPPALSPDAAPDAPVPVVELPSCPSTVAATIMDSASAFIPVTSTISVGQVAKFVITAEHTVIPNPLKSTDPALMVGRGQTKCFRFNVAGTYNFLCGVHSFPGAVVVQ